MALTRKMLKAMSIADEVIDQIIDAHSETVSALQAMVDQYKVEAEKLPKVQKELDNLREEIKTNENNNPFKAKYEALQDEFKDYKSSVDKDRLNMKKQKAIRDLLLKVGVLENRIDSVLKVMNLDDYTLTDSEELEHADELSETFKSEWADFIPSHSDKTPPPETPPGVYVGVTKEQFRSMSYAERVKLKEDNPDLYKQLRV